MSNKTLLEARTRVLYKLGDASNSVWSNTEIDQYLNDGHQRLVYIVKPLWGIVYRDDVAGTAVCPLPDDCLEIDRVTWNNQVIPMLTRSELARLDVNYTTQRGPVRAYTLDGETPGYMRKWLVPAVSAAPNQDERNTRLEYYKRAPILNENDTFSVPDRYVTYIEHYAMYRALERKGPGQHLKAAQHYKARFEEGVARMSTRLIRVKTARRLVVTGVESATERPLPGPRLPWNFGRIRRWP